MKRIICILLTIVFLTNLCASVSAKEPLSGPKSEKGQKLLDFMQGGNDELLVLRKNYGYMSFVDSFNSDTLSVYLLEMTNTLIGTGAKPDKDKYIEVLVNIIATNDMDRAHIVAEQKKMDNLKSIKDYAMDFTEMGMNAVSVMAGTSAQIGELENGISLAVDGVYTLADNTNNWIDALSNLETIVQDYAEHDDFLRIIEEQSDGELKEAAHTLRIGMNSAFKIKLETYADISDKNFNNYGEYFFSDVFFETLKHVPEYERDESLKYFVDGGENVLSKLGALKSAWELGTAIGTLVGDVVAGGENLINRILELMAIHDISVILQKKITDTGFLFMNNLGTEKEEEIANNYIACSNYLIGCRIRGEYCIYSIVVKDAGLLSWFGMGSSEQAKKWYDNKVKKIQSIQQNLTQINKTENDVWKVINKDKPTYMDTINSLLKRYGSLRIVQNVGDWKNEANGLCYLNLVDFTGDGKDELFAVCKKEDEKHYTGYIYTMTNEGPKLLHEISQIEYSVRGFDIVNVGYTADTGYIYGTGWEGADADDMTFFWYKNGTFEPVYRYKGYWDGDLEDEIVDEEAITVDIFDDEHRDEYYNNFPEVTLRSPDETNSRGDYFDLSELQKTIDDVVRKLGIDLSDLPSSITFSEERLKDLSVVAIYHCIEDDLDEWMPDVKDTETFWDVMCFYCDFTDRISSSNYPIVGEDAGYQAIPDNILKNAAYAIYKDFDGNLPAIDSDVWRANYYNEEATGIIVGDDAPIIVTSEDYQQNEDGTIDAVYDIQYVGDFPAGTYKVHFEPNTHYNEVDADAAFYYRVSHVEVLEKPSISNDSRSEELTMEEYGIPYGHYSGGKPQGDGVFGLDMDLYEDMTFSIVSAFDLFSDEDGDEYVYTGTYKIERVNDEGNPVLRLHCDEGDYEFVWDGEELLNDPIFAWYEGELSTSAAGNSNYTEPEDDHETVQITDISQVVEKDLGAVDAAHILDLEYDVIEDDYHYFYQDTTCDEKHGMLWCDDYQKEEINNWKYNPGETGIAIYGVVSGMSRESLLSLMENQHFSATDYFGGEDDGNLYYTVNKDQFVIGVKLESDIVADVTIFSAANY